MVCLAGYDALCNLAKGDIAVLSYSPGGSMRREVGPGVHLEVGPHFGRREGLRVSNGTIRKSDGGLLYRLFIETIALEYVSLTIRPQFASDVSVAQINRGGSLWGKI